MKEHVKENIKNTKGLMANITKARYKQLDEHRYIPIIDMISPHIKSKDAPLLDIGIREGAFLKTLKKHGFSSLHGVDIYEEGVGQAMDAGFDCKVSDAEELDFGKTFDTITISHVLEHCPDMDMVIANIYKHLNNDGILFVEVPQEEKEDVYPTKHAHYHNFTTLGELISIFNGSNWLVLDSGTNSNGKRLKVVVRKV